MSILLVSLFINVQDLRHLGADFAQYASSMFVQTTLVVLAVLILDWLLRRRVRAVFRYWMWMLVIVKLVTPPTLSLPTSVSYWCADALSDRIRDAAPGRSTVALPPRIETPGHVTLSLPPFMPNPIAVSHASEISPTPATRRGRLL